MTREKHFLDEEQIETLVNRLADEIITIHEVQAVVLGGSRARGTHQPGSDIDLGIYYNPGRQPDLASLSLLAAAYDDEHRSGLLTSIGGWGPWINGGGWLTVQGTPVDFLYRDLQTVEDCLNDCLAGSLEIHYQPGHPFGFLNSMYFSEIAMCRILREKSAAKISSLKKLTNPYPPALRQALIEKFAWEIDFSLGNARKGISRLDITYISGCCFRAAACMLQVLFALNGLYWLNEKGAAALLETQPVKPAAFKYRLETAFTRINSDPVGLAECIEQLNTLAIEISALVQTHLPVKNSNR